MADVNITLTIPGEKVAIALEGFLEIYPNVETIADPEWEDPEDGTKAPEIDKYTNKQWVTEQIRRLIIRDVRRGLQMKANKLAKIEEDDGLVQ